MKLTIDPANPTPSYEQLRRQLADLVGAGVLPAGHRLPPVRQLAGDLGLAVGTVARAYRELEQAGLLISRRGGGTRVAPRPSDATDPLTELTAEFVRRVRELGYSDDRIADAFGKQIHQPGET